MRHLDDEDLDAIAVLLDARILSQLSEMEQHIMSSLADLLTEDASLNDEINQVIALVQQDATLINDLKGTIGSGNLNPTQQSQVDALFAQMTAQHDAIVAALQPAPAPAPAPTPAAFVVKVAGESFTDYQARVAAWNADPANANDQVTEAAEADWDALPVS